MAFATETLIGDRFYAVHQTTPFSGLKARRLWPTNYVNTAFHPLIVAEPGAVVSATTDGNIQTITRLWNCILILGT